MRKLSSWILSVFFIELIVCGLVFSSLIQVSVVHASTQVSGVINSDTTWNIENSPYLVTNDIFISEEVTLTVEPGVEVTIAEGFSILLGFGATLQSLGTEQNPILFTANGTTYQGAWKGILIHAGTNNTRVYLNHTLIECAEKAVGFTESSGDRNNVEVVVDNSKLINNTEGIGFHTPYKVDKLNLFVNNSLIEGNAIGVNLYSPFFNSTIAVSANIVVNNVVGIRLSDGVHEITTAFLQKNMIIWNDIGIQVGVGGSSGLGLGSPVHVLQNNIAKNRLGISVNLYHHYPNGNLLVNNNNIYSNTEHDFEVATGYGVYSDYNTTYNWWGTTDIKKIEHTIYDFNDDFNLGTATFIPFLNEPNPDAPSLSFDVDFTCSPEDVYAHGTVTFDASANFSKYSKYSNFNSYVWDFGDGNVSTSNTPTMSHIYTVPDDYTITLTVKDDLGFQNSATRIVTVLQDNMAPSTTSDYIDSWHTSDFSINLTAVDHQSGVAETFYRINEGATETVSASGQPLINIESANITLECWSEDNAGNLEPAKLETVKMDKTVPFIEVKINDVAVNADQFPEVSVDQTIAFDATASSDNIGIVNYVWDFGNGATGTGATTSYTYTKGGTYTTTLTISDIAGNTNTKQFKIIVKSSETLLLVATAVAAIITTVAVTWFIRKKRKQP